MSAFVVSDWLAESLEVARRHEVVAVGQAFLIPMQQTRRVSEFVGPYYGAYTTPLR